MTGNCGGPLSRLRGVFSSLAKGKALPASGVNQSRWAALALICLLLLLPGKAPTESPDAEISGDRVLAMVNQQIFTLRDMEFWMLDYRLNRPEVFDIPDEILRRELVGDVVDDYLLRSWAELEIEGDLPPEAIESRYRAAMERYQRLAGGSTRFQQLLRELQIDPFLFRRWVREQARGSMIVREAVTGYVVAGGQTPFDGSVADAHRLRLAHILVEANLRRETERERAYERALRIRRDVTAGLSFAEAARLYSDDEATRPIGGELGWFEDGEVNPALWEAARSVKHRTPTPPVETGAGYHLVMVLDYETPEQREYFRRVREFEARRIRELRRTNDVRLAEGYALHPLPEDAAPEEPGFWDLIDIEQAGAELPGPED